MSQSSAKNTNKKTKLNLEFDTSEMSATQVRLIKTLTAALANVMVTEDECEYFEQSSEILRLCASIVQESNFSTISAANKSSIPYGEQALEFALDNLTEQMAMAKVVKYDN